MICKGIAMKRYRLTALLFALCFVLTACAGEEGSAGASSSSGDVSQEEEQRPRTTPFTLAVPLHTDVHFHVLRCTGML